MGVAAAADWVGDSWGGTREDEDGEIADAEGA